MRISHVGRACTLLLLSVLAVDLEAQSLGDVARREAERRKGVDAGRVYTNENLGPADSGAAPVPASVHLEPPAAGGSGTAEAPAAASPVPGAAESNGPSVGGAPSKRSEQYWRKLMGDLRAQLAQATSMLATQEARLAAVDAAPATPASTREREVVAASIPGLQKNIRYQNEEIARFVARAAAEKVPADWVR